MEMNCPVKRSGQERGREDLWVDRRAGVKAPRRDRDGKVQELKIVWVERSVERRGEEAGAL